MPAFLAAITAGISGFSSRGARRMTSTCWAIIELTSAHLLGGRAGGVGVDELVQPRLAASSFMLAVCARRHGLLLSVWAKPTL